MDEMWGPTDIDDLLFPLEKEWPDPVDTYEDELAAAEGIFRFPTLSYEDWRRLRVRGIDAATEDSQAKVT